MPPSETPIQSTCSTSSRAISAASPWTYVLGW
jgi:hypothetical protein